MNGNQGLEALASLCGGASKARTQGESSQTNQGISPDDASMMPPPSGHLVHPNVMNLQNHGISNKSQISQQQLFQAVLSAANSGGNINPFALQNAAYHQRGIPNAESNSAGTAQQIAYYNHLYNTQVAAQQALQYSKANQQQNNNGYDNKHNNIEQHIAAALALASGSGSAYPQMRFQGNVKSPNEENPKAEFSQQQIQQQLLSGATQDQDSQVEGRSPSFGSKSQINISPNLSDLQSQYGVSHVSPQPQLNFNHIQQDVSNIQAAISSDYNTSEDVLTSDDRKQVKRAANRRSAQLSRKRKKQFIEELKEENDDLRRKEQILRSIPDLVVVFDSAGKLGFVSQSVGRFLAFTSESLEGTSFWNRLCDESVRLLKAAFMDALAARKAGMDTTPLGDGLWELRLVDKDGKHKIVILNGVVHFTGDSPECVCCIRPRDDSSVQYLKVSSSMRVTSPMPRNHNAANDDISVQQNLKQLTTTLSPNDATSNNSVKSKITETSKHKSSSKVNPVSDGESVISENASISS